MKKRLEVGVSVETSLGLVSEYDEREACSLGNYNWTEWESLNHLERARVVAYYRVHHYIEANVQDAISKDIDKKSRRKGK